MIAQEKTDKIKNLAIELFPINRSLTGKGNIKTLKYIKKKINRNFKIKKVKSNTQCYDWTIPKEWNVKKAFIIDPEGKKICDFNENNLHLMGYSTPVNKIISKNDLEKNLYSLPRQPNAIPYITSYYKKNWGFSLTHRERIKLKKGNYKILIDTNFKNGVLLRKNDINSLKEFESIILFTSAGLLTKTNLNLFLEEVKLLDIDIKGFVYLDPYLKDTSL